MSSSSRAERRPHLGRAAAFALLLVLAVGPPIGAPAAPAEATGACRSIPDGRLQSGAGPSRATVVVDTGSGTVWSACISFSGSTSGIGALDLASRVIPGLSPTYDVYPGEGRAVCKLLGVGNDPPDCLGKTVQYWGYFHNGRYSSSGAGAMTVRDGDVESWRWGTSGATPRRAGAGSEAVASPPPTTAPPTTHPTMPPPTSPSGAMSGSVPTSADPDPQAGAPTAGASPDTPTGPSTPTSVTIAGGATASSTTTVPTRASDGSEQAAAAKGNRGASATEQAAGPSSGAPSGGATGSGSGGSSGWTSAATFGLALAAIVGIGLFLRSRRPAPA